MRHVNKTNDRPNVYLSMDCNFQIKKNSKTSQNIIEGLKKP